MRLQHLQLLLTLARTGSLRAAAQELNVTQPALTKALRQLEEEFGATLVLRSPKGVRLAPAGELLAARAATIVREIDRAREDVDWSTRQGRASVTVGLSPAAALMLAAPAVARFHDRWPEVRVRLVDALYPKALRQLRGSEVDFALGPLPSVGMGRDLHALPLLHSPTVIVARRGHPMLKATTLAALAGASWILSGPPLGPGDPVQLGMEQRGLGAARVAMECESFATLLAVLPHTEALALVPRRFFESHGPQSSLEMLKIAEDLPVTTLHLFTRTDAPLTVPAQRLVNAFKDEAEAILKRRAAVGSGA